MCRKPFALILAAVAASFSVSFAQSGEEADDDWGLPPRDAPSEEEAVMKPTWGVSYAVSGVDGIGAEGDFTLRQDMEASLVARFGQAATLDASLALDTSRDYAKNPLAPDELVSQLSLSFRPIPFLALTAGKQRLSWGSARALGSIDRLESLPDPVPGASKSRLPGTIGLKGDFIATGELAVSFFAAPNREPEWSSGAMRLEALLGELDVGLGATTFAYDRLTGYSVVSRSAVTERSRRWACFADAAWFGDLAGVYAEFQAANARSTQWAWLDGGAVRGESANSAESDWIFKITAGTQVDVPVWLDGTMRIIAEWHFDGDGLAVDEMGRLAAAAEGKTLLHADAGISSGAVSRHNAYLGVSGVPIVRKLRFGCGALAAPETGFAVVSASLSWDVTNELGISLAWSQARNWFGSAVSEESLFPWRNRVSLSFGAAF